MSKLRFNYGFRAHEVLHHPEAPQRIRWLKECGVETIWLDGYFYGHYEADDETMLAAKRRLEDEGFDVNAISVPVGHPGNSLNPEDDTLELEIPKTWRYRMEPDCKPHFFCACIEDVMVEDNGRAAEKYAQMGFRKLFFDDDLRMGECGREIGGCFCPACMKEFNQKTGLALQPKALDELTAETGVDEAEALEALELSAAAAPVSLDAQMGADEDDAPLSQFLGFDEAGFADFERRDQLSRAMEALDERQREVLRQRYFENRTQRDVAARMNLSQMTVSRVERAALEALKEKLSPQEGNRGEKL